VAGVAVLVLVALVAWRWLGPATPPQPPRVETAAVSAAAPRAATRDATANASPAPASDALRAPRATGRVVDREGRPIAGARVVSCPDDLHDPILPAEASVASTTDADGRFAIDVDERTPFAWLFVEAAGFSPEAADSVRRGEDVTVTLDASRTLTGVVMDRDATPIAGATLRWLGVLGPCRVERETRSAADGSYRLDDVPTAAAVRRSTVPMESLVEVRADGFAPAEIVVRPLPDGRLDVVLLVGATLRGRVVDADSGEPLAGARVVCWASQGSGGWIRGAGLSMTSAYHDRPIGETRSGSDGRFVLEHVPAAGLHPIGSSTVQNGRHILGLVAADVPGLATATVPVFIPEDGEDVDATLACWPTCDLHGRVVDSTGAPIAGATAFVDAPERARGWLAGCFGGRSVRPGTDADGRYVLTGVPAPRGTYVSAPLRASCGPGWNPTASVDVRLRAGETIDAPDVVLERVRVPEAIVDVVDAAGAPLWGAFATNAGEIVTNSSARTDREGRARILFFDGDGDGDGEPVRHRMIVTAKGFARATSDEFVPSVESPPVVRVVMQPPHRVAGRVLQEDGAPVAEASVVVYDANAIERTWRTPAFGHASTDSTGAFEASGLPAGPYALAVERSLGPHGGAAAVARSRASLENVPTDAADLLLRLPNVPPGGAVEGNVRDAATGRRLLSFAVKVERDDEYVSGAATRPGAFRLGGVPAGTWTLRVTADGFAPFERGGVEVTTGGLAGPIDVTLAAGIVLRGRVHVPAGVDARTVILSLWDPRSDVRFRAPLDADGSFAVRGARPGTYQVSARIGDSMAGPFVAFDPPTRLVVKAGARDVAFDGTLVPAARLEVEVACARLPEAGGPDSALTPAQRETHAGARLEMRNAAGDIVAERPRLDAGWSSYVLPGGVYVVRVEVPGAEPVEKTVVVEEGKDAGVRFEIR
jgi:protocatechuate 3,4-dioxygenase beta subunit